MIRERKNLTQIEMAKLMGISPSYYQKVERGFKEPSYNFIRKYKSAFPDVNVKIFFNQKYHY